MYIVARTILMKDEKTSIMSEQFHETLDLALVDYNQRMFSGNRDLFIAKILPVKTVIVDFDSAGIIEVPLT